VRMKTAPAKVKTVAQADDLAEGEFEAIVSVFNTVDSVGDVVMPGAFKNTLSGFAEKSAPVPIVWSHDWSDPFSHIGYSMSAEEVDAGLKIRGKLDIENNPKAAQVYRLLKGGRVRDFSFAYEIKDGGFREAKDGEDDYDTPYELRELELFEVGPCLVGAHRDTELLDIKTGHIGGKIKKAIGSHSTDTTDGSWDGPGNVSKLPADASASQLRGVFAWVDPDGDPTAKSSYKFPHHMVSDGSGGAASVKGCTAAIAALNGARGGSSIPDADRKGVYNHLAKHLRDAGVEDIPELKTDDPAPSEPVDLERIVAEAAAKFAHDLLAAVNGQQSKDANGQAMPVQPAAAEDPAGGKADVPARPGAASERLRTDLRLLVAEVDLFADEGA
jgi:HK97 family phage prohead protease